MIKYDLYHNIIFDFDGVIVDSNSIKKRCIESASEKVCEPQKQYNFVEYFVQNNGIPREHKINLFFQGQDALTILSQYNECLKSMFDQINLTNGILEFLELLKFYKRDMYVLSGGDKKEVENLINKLISTNMFVSTMGGPKTKEENLESLFLNGKTLFIGDSKKDYEIAEQYGFDFIFIYGYTQFDKWKDFFKNKDILMSIRDFSVLTNCKC